MTEIGKGKAPKVLRKIDEIAKGLGGPGLKAAEQGRCVLCGKAATEFDDTLSVKEYRISGMCQKCQDVAFAEPEEEL